MRRLLIAAVVGGLALVASPFARPAEAAGAVPCTGNVVNKTVNADMYVPAGAECDVWDSTVNGSITVHPGGDFAIASATVKGSINGTNPEYFYVKKTTVGGSVNLNGAQMSTYFDCPRIVGNLTVTGVSGNHLMIGECEGGTPPRVLGNVTLSNNPTNVYLRDAIVSGSALISGNTGAKWAVEDNSIANTLNCSGNAGMSWGGNNTAKAKLGQCAGF